jgi:hypothetical protein
MMIMINFKIMIMINFKNKKMTNFKNLSITLTISENLKIYKSKFLFHVNSAGNYTKKSLLCWE